MDKSRLNRFKELLSVPSKTYQEDMMVEYIQKTLNNIPNVEYYTDKHNNIYAKKGVICDGDYYPMFIAHTDTVHSIVDEIIVREEMKVKPHTFGHSYTNEKHLSLKGYTTEGTATGIGGDDKCGIFIALELLRILPTVKVGLFVSEETGCHGSSKCDIEFLKDVGYAVQFDAPGNNLITETCSGTRLYEKDGTFIKLIKPLFEDILNVKSDEQSHPYTDIMQIKKKGDFSCINFSCGYYNMHSSEEFVVVSDVEKSIEFAKEIVFYLGLEKYKYQATSNYNYDFSDNDDDFSEIIYQDLEEKVIDMERLIVTTSDDNLIIESKFTGDVIMLDKDEILDLYEILKIQFIDY